MKQLIANPWSLLSRHLTLWHQAIHDRTILEYVRNRVSVAGIVFSLAFIVIGLRLADVMLFNADPERSVSRLGILLNRKPPRADILDRNREVLATHLVTASVYANPREIINAQEAVAKLKELIPELDQSTLLQKLTSNRGFVWIIRHIPPKLQHAVNCLGIPGVHLQRDHRRIYPHGSLVSHVLGYCGIDGNGLAGIEKTFDRQLSQGGDPLVMALDIRIQHVLRDELLKAMTEFLAVGGNAMVMNIKTGEILAMVSLPDYDPNLPNQNDIATTFNRNTLGQYEPGSIMKVLNTAIALETERITLTSLYDARIPIKVGKNLIDDFKPKRRILSVKEGFIYSSNIVAAKMALDFGGKMQKEYLKKLGLLSSAHLELPEIGAPLVPAAWRDATTMTVAYGYGLAVSPLQTMIAVAAMVNNGILIPPTLLKQDRAVVEKITKTISPIISAKTSHHIRELMRLAVLQGTVKKAEAPGYQVIAKTGTAHKNQRGHYTGDRIASCVAAFPKEEPLYIVYFTLDNPKPTKATYGYATAGWTAASGIGKTIKRIAPLLGLSPVEELEKETFSRFSDGAQLILTGDVRATD